MGIVSKVVLGKCCSIRHFFKFVGICAVVTTLVKYLLFPPYIVLSFPQLGVIFYIRKMVENIVPLHSPLMFQLLQFSPTLPVYLYFCWRRPYLVLALFISNAGMFPSINRWPVPPITTLQSGHVLRCMACPHPPIV